MPTHPFDLNAATLKQLEELPGVGPVTAHAILNFREKSGPFKSVNDLLVISRISKKKLDKIRPYVFVKPPGNAKSSAAPSKKSASPKSFAPPAKSTAPNAKPPAKAAAPAKAHAAKKPSAAPTSQFLPAFAR